MVLVTQEPPPPGGQTSLATTDEIIAETRAGRMFILVDAEDRENEGDLVIPAGCADASHVNFMARHARGLICLAVSRTISERLRLAPMGAGNASRHETTFTVSIEAREGVTTGISAAADRAHTIATAVDPDSRADDIVTPGHVFPLVARDGGVLVRAGHTEAAVDLARLAGRGEAGVICEILNEDGTMARLPELIEFARVHRMKIGTIADLIAHRRRRERLVERTVEKDIVSREGGPGRLIIFRDKTNGAEHVAFVSGEITPAASVLVRMHRLNVAADLLGDTSSRPDQIGTALRQIAAATEPAVIVLIRDPRPNWLSAASFETGGTGEESARRDYGIGAQILLDLGVRRMTLLTDATRSLPALEGYDLVITGRRRLNEP